MQRLGHDATNALARVERAIGVLKHHLECGPQGAQLWSGQGMQVVPLKPDAALAGRIQRHDEPRQRGFAAA